MFLILVKTEKNNLIKNYHWKQSLEKAKDRCRAQPSVLVWRTGLQFSCTVVGIHGEELWNCHPDCSAIRSFRLLSTLSLNQPSSSAYWDNVSPSSCLQYETIYLRV